VFIARVRSQLLVVASMALAMTAAPARVAVASCGPPNCGIEECPQDLNAWCRAVGCPGGGLCFPFSECGGELGIACFP
jgi:hypothetical protein